MFDTQALSYLLRTYTIRKPFSMLSDNRHYLTPVPAPKTYGIFSVANHRCLNLLQGELIQEIRDNGQKPHGKIVVRS